MAFVEDADREAQAIHSGRGESEVHCGLGDLQGCIRAWAVVLLALSRQILGRDVKDDRFKDGAHSITFFGAGVVATLVATRAQWIGRATGHFCVFALPRGAGERTAVIAIPGMEEGVTDIGFAAVRTDEFNFWEQVTKGPRCCQPLLLDLDLAVQDHLLYG